MIDLPAARELMVAMLDAFQASDNEHPQVPAGREEDVRALLTRALTDVAFGLAYSVQLECEIKRWGRAFKVRMLARNCPDIPEAAIIANGFVGLSAEILADLATSPEAIEALWATVCAPENLAVGCWLMRTES